MISKFRKGADSLFVRIILGLIALSFVAVGGTSLVKSSSSGDVISFSKTESISFEKFHYAKKKEIELIQKQNGIHLTEENIAEFGVDNAVLKKLVNESMIDYLAKYYEFDISDEKVIAFVKETPFFNNSKGEFDLSLFKNTFNNSPVREQEYLNGMKRRFIASVVLGIFKDNYHTSKILRETIVNYMAETRTVDLFSVDMSYRPFDYRASKYSQEELNQYYLENKTAFMQPPSRSFEYIKADKKFLEKRINISDNDLKTYFDENKDEYNGKKFLEVKKQIKDLLRGEKLIEVSGEIAKNFEEAVSSGLTLKEIANKYSLPLKSVKDITLSKMIENEEEEYAKLADNVFEMNEGEVSYPVEIPATSEIMLVSVKSILQGRQREFKDVEKLIIDILEKRDLANYNMKNFKETLNAANLNKIDKASLASKGINLINNQTFTRVNLANDKLPSNLLKAIFSIQLNQSTNIITNDNMAYFAYLKKIENEKNIADKIRKDDDKHIAAAIKEGIFQELIDHLSKLNNMKINNK